MLAYLWSKRKFCSALINSDSSHISMLLSLGAAKPAWDSIVLKIFLIFDHCIPDKPLPHEEALPAIPEEGRWGLQREQDRVPVHKQNHRPLNYIRYFQMLPNSDPTDPRRASWTFLVNLPRVHDYKHLNKPQVYSMQVSTHLWTKCPGAIIAKIPNSM